MHILIINLSSAVKRREFQHLQLQKLNLGYEILPATCVNDIDIDTYKKHSQDWQRPLKKTELACYFSHRHAWEAVIARGQPALILEDDALLSKYVPELLATLEKRTGADMINLEVRSRKKFVAKTGEDIGCRSQLYRLYQDRTGAAGYILWPSGAQKLLQHERINGIALADAHITACHNLISYQVEPAAIIQLDQRQPYGLNIDDCDDISLSTVSSRNADKGDVFFWVKRLSSQFKLGLRQIYLIFITTRRYITLRKDDFSHD